MALIYNKNYINNNVINNLEDLKNALSKYSDNLSNASNDAEGMGAIYNEAVSKLKTTISNINSEISKLISSVKDFSDDVSTYEPGLSLPTYENMTTSTYGGGSATGTVSNGYARNSGAVYGFSGGSYSGSYSGSSYTSSDSTISYGSKYSGRGYMTDDDWEKVSSVIDKNDFKCRCGNNCEGKDANVIKKQLVLDLVKISEHFGGKKIHVTSGYRCPSHNAAQAGSSSTSFHMSGAAVDFWIEGVSAYEIIEFAKTLDSYNYAYTNNTNMGGAVHYDIGNYEPPKPEIEEIDGITYIDGILIANKSYALPASYNPGVNSEAKSALDKLQAAALSAGISLPTVSDFRSYSEQSAIYNNYVNNDGQANADRYSARPGHSEHQTGLAFDLLSAESENIPVYENEFAWLAEHAHEYGFIIRYPKGKESITGYKYEPWHVRYVGVDAATAIKESGLCLEEYFDIGVSAYK